MTENPSLVTARALVSTLIAAEVPAAAYCPGSRNAPMAYALAQAEADNLLRVATFSDERSAGFWAVGFAKATHQPVAVVTTSGTAVAELYPAVTEASHQELPVLVLSADRPHHMRGVGASQTTTQDSFFGSFVVADASIPADAIDSGQTVTVLARLIDAARQRPGPVHLNVAFADPLVPTAPGQLPDVTLPVRVPSRVENPAWEDLCLPDLATVVVAGDAADPRVLASAEARAVPILAEPSSGATGIPAWVPHAPDLLRGFAGTRLIEQVVVTGHPTLTRPVTRLIANPSVRKVVCSTRRVYPDVAGTASVIAEGMTFTLPGSDPDLAWLASWQAASAVAGSVISEVSGGSLNLLSVARAIWHSPPQPDLWLAASNPVRAFDLVADTRTENTVYANRGLAGIDGSVAGALGVAQGTGRAVRAVLGDMAFAADVSSLSQRPGGSANLQVVVLNDSGGGIFASLEHGAAPAKVYERFFAVPPRLDVLAAAAAAGWKATQVSNLEELKQVLSAPVQGIEVVEVPIPRPAELLKTMSKRIAEALAAVPLPR